MIAYMKAFRRGDPGYSLRDLILRGAFHPQVVAVVCKTSDLLGLPVVADTYYGRLGALDDLYQLRSAAPVFAADKN